MAIGDVRYLEFFIAAYLPDTSNAIVGMVGPASKGAVNQRIEFTDEGNFVNVFGRPRAGHYGPHGAIKYLKRGDQLNYVRVAGSNLSSASVASVKEVNGSNIDLLTFTATSGGTWANNEVSIEITLNGSPATTYNIRVLFQGTPVETYENLTNGIVVNTINTRSSRVRVALNPDAGTILPDSTVDANTGASVPLVLSGGNDGAFASTNSANSSTLGIGAANSFSYAFPFNGTTDFTQDEPRGIAPGTLSITDGTETFTDNGDGTLTGSATGTGVVNYSTGVWSVTFNAAPAANLTVTYEVVTEEVLGSLTAGTNNYGSTISRIGLRPNTLAIYDSRSYQLDLGDGATAAYVANIGTDVLPGSVQITATDVSGNTMIVTDDGNGALTGSVAVAGTVNYATGAISWTFNANVVNAGAIISTHRNVIVDDGVGALTGSDVTGTINYETGAWTLVYSFTPVGDFVPGVQTGGVLTGLFKHVSVIGTGDAVETDFEGTLLETPVKPGSVVVTHALGATLTDDGSGNLSGAGGTGTVNYFTGEVTVALSGAVANGFPVQVAADVIVLDFESRFVGDIGNERPVLTDGLHITVDRSTASPIDPISSQFYRVQVLFNDGSGATAVETFDQLRSLENLIEVVNDPDNGSTLVRAISTNQLGEADVSSAQTVGMSGAFTIADVIGEVVGVNRTGMQLFTNDEEVPMHFLSVPGQWHRQVITEGLRISRNRRLVWMNPLPDITDPLVARDFVNGSYNAASTGGTAIPTADVPFPPLVEIDDSYGFSVFSWLQYFDQYTNSDLMQPPEGDVLALAAQTDQRFDPWLPISGERRGQFTDVNALRTSPTREQRRLIQGQIGDRIEVINPIVDIVGRGVFLQGEQTMARNNDPVSRLHIRWTSNLIGNSFIAIGRGLLFEQIDSTLFRETRVKCNKILKPIASRRGLTSYRVVCDHTTNLPETIRQRQLIAKIFVQFTEAAEEIEFQAIFTPQGTDFELAAPTG